MPGFIYWVSAFTSENNFYCFLSSEEDPRQESCFSEKTMSVFQESTLPDQQNFEQFLSASIMGGGARTGGHEN